MKAFVNASVRVAAVGVCLAACFLFAQEFRGTITGHVTDAQDAAVPNVKLQLTLVSTGAKYETVSSADGSYTIPFLTPGIYRIDVEAAGFKRYQRQGVQVTTNDRLQVDIRLEVGQVAETVTITAEVPLLQTVTASTGQVISQQQIENMPLNGRTPMIAAQRAYGVIASSNDSLNRVRPTDNAFAAGISMGGAPQQRNELLIDGAQNTTLNQRVAFNPPVDTVAEVKVESFQSDAAYGHTGGGTVNVVLKGGTNQFHGSLYEFNQVARLTAANFFNNRNGQPKANALLNQFGATFGGPVVIPGVINGRNKLFFYGAWERMDNNRANPSFATVPTQAMRRGDLSALLSVPGANAGQYQIYDPLTGVVEGARIRRLPFAGNIIPQNRLNPIAQNYLNTYWKDPNAPGQADGAQNFFAGGNGEKTGYNQEMGRIDWNVSDRHKLFINARRNIRIGSGANSLGHPISSESSGTGTIRINWGSTLDDVYTVSPTLLLNTRLNFVRYTEDIQNYSFPYDMTRLGFSPSLAALSRRPTLPRIQMDDFTGVGATAGNVQPFYTYQLNETATKILSKHTMKFGADLRQYRDLETNYGFTSGSYAFSTNWTRGPLDNSAEAPLGQDLAAFLLGMPTGGFWDVNGSRTNHSGYYAFFFQDDWRVKRNLTLNLGIRWEKETPTTEDYNRIVRGFDRTTPNPVSAAALAAYARNPIPQVPVSDFRVNGGLLFADANNREIYQTSNKAWSPRFGFAWTPGALGGKTVIRGGMGVFFFPYSIVGAGNQQGFNEATQLVATLNNYLTPSATLSNPFPNGLVTPRGAADGLGTFLGREISFSNPSLAAPYSIRWNFDIQHQLANNLVLTVGYMHNHAVRLPIASNATNSNLNAVPAQYLSTSPDRDNAANNVLTGNVTNPFAGLIPGQSLNGSTTQRQQLLRPFPQFGNVLMQNRNEGSSYFHLLDIRLEKRYSNGLLLLTSYGFSRQMERMTRLNPQDIALEKRVGNEDRPHRFVASGMYDLPFGRGKALLGGVNKVVDHLIGGWNVNAIYTYQSGAPVTFGNVIYYGGDLRWNPRNIDRVFDITQFNRISNQQLVSNIRTFPTRFSNLRADAVNSWDISIIKNFNIWERVKLQYRAEAFNALNTPRFAAPNVTPTASQFGASTSQFQDQPRAIQMALRLTW